jgi:hypothetical protein
MVANVGSLDRVIRAAIGAALIVFAFFSGLPLFDAALWRFGAAAAGVVLLIVALVRVCPIYAVLGIRTCPV